MSRDSVLSRTKRRRLPSVDVPQVSNNELRRSLEALKEHLRMYEGDSGAPKERFVTIKELELAGLIDTKLQNNFALIDKVLGDSVAQGQQAVASPQTGQQPASSGGGNTLAHLKDTSVDTATADDFLVFTAAGNWVNFPLFNSPISIGATWTFNAPTAGIDHVDLENKGNYAHSVVDSHIDDADIHHGTHYGEVTGADELSLDVTAITNQSDVLVDPDDDVAVHDDSDGLLKKTNVSSITDGGYF